MRKRIHKILVTGGAGFIGSEFVRQLSREYPRKKGGLIVVDKLTYAGDLVRLAEARGKYKFYKSDICDKARMNAIFKKERPQVVVNFAAETHVDRSIADASVFIETNVKGAHTLLEVSKKYNIDKFFQISTDEVYGDIKRGRFNENSPLKPNSPYAASKAAADLLIRSYVRTYGFPAVIIRPCNNYGPWQYPEKLIPVIINNALRGRKVPIYAKGMNRREWLHVSDCAGAVIFLLDRAWPGEIYNLGSGHEEKNIDVARKILTMLGKPPALIKFVKDRPGHDLRYALDSSKLRMIGWGPKMNFSLGLGITVGWNKENHNWLIKK
ncbi:MAG: dTDP-glucose 4,6-dehydratase [Candidatus Omnitrophota bacterium]|jgi:dTDP-glucose 4,6-dehydratase